MELTCIVCPAGCPLTVTRKDGTWTVTGHTCPKGREFALREATDPRRSLCTTIRTADPQKPRLPVRTDGEIPKGLIFPAMEVINRAQLMHPVRRGDVVIPNILDTGVNIISTSDM